MYYIPSIEKEIVFNPLTIGQFKEILNNKFNFSFIKILKENCTESINLTNFDKEVVLLQIHFNEIIEKNILNKIIEHPKEQIVEEGLYKITIMPPTLTQELETCLYIDTLNEDDKDSLLLGEIAKYTSSLIVNNEEINWNIKLFDKIKFLKEVPSYILAKCIICIDNVKKQVKTYYQQNNTNYKYDISLLVP